MSFGSELSRLLYLGYSIYEMKSWKTTGASNVKLTVWPKSENVKIVGSGFFLLQPVIPHFKLEVYPFEKNYAT